MEYERFSGKEPTSLGILEDILYGGLPRAIKFVGAGGPPCQPILPGSYASRSRGTQPVPPGSDRPEIFLHLRRLRGGYSGLRTQELAELREVIAAWPKLSAELRAAVRAVTRTATR
jgi:hypothetical protein